MLCQSSLVLLHKMAFQPFWLPVTVCDLEKNGFDSCIFQDQFFTANRCCCSPSFEGDSFTISFQTINTTWDRGYNDPNSKRYKVFMLECHSNRKIKISCLLL